MTAICKFWPAIFLLLAVSFQSTGQSPKRDDGWEVDEKGLRKLAEVDPWSELPANAKKIVDQALREADRSRSIPQIGQTIVNAIHVYPALDLPTLERRFRALGTQTYLIAAPLSTLPKDQTVFYPYTSNNSHYSQELPLHHLWVSSNGAKEAAEYRKRFDVHSDEENFKRLRYTGFAVPFSNLYKQMETRPDAKRVPATNPRQVELFRVLEDYVRDGNMTDEYNHQLARLLNGYLAQPAYRRLFSINLQPSADRVNVYALSKDPGSHFSETSCNCAYITETSTIVCDAAMLREMQKIIFIKGNLPGAQDALDFVNRQHSFFVLQWIVGHEMGHLLLNHRYDETYFTFDRSPTQRNRIPPKLKRELEEAADTFAVSNLRRDNEKFFAWGALSNLIATYYGAAATSEFKRSGQKYDQAKVRDRAVVITLRDTNAAHPVFLIRALNLVETVLKVHPDVVIDTTGYFDRVRANVKLARSGLDTPGICSSAKP